MFQPKAKKYLVRHWYAINPSYGQGDYSDSEFDSPEDAAAFLAENKRKKPILYIKANYSIRKSGYELILKD